MSPRNSIPVYPIRAYKTRYARVQFRNRKYVFKDLGTEESKAIFRVWRELLRPVCESDALDAEVPTVDDALRRYRELEIGPVPMTEDPPTPENERPRVVNTFVEPTIPIEPGPDRESPDVQVKLELPARPRLLPTLAICIACSLITVMSYTALQSQEERGEIVIDTDLLTDNVPEAWSKSLPKGDARKMHQHLFFEELHENIERTSMQGSTERAERTKRLACEYHEARRKKDLEVVGSDAGDGTRISNLNDARDVK
jgi:hypothetical protein